jgi:large subunit ribosomal protein L30
VVRQKTGTIHIKWVRSGIALPRQQKEMVASLGLGRLNQVVERPDTIQVRGVVAKIPHLLQVVPAPTPPAWAAVPEYVIVAAKAPPKPEKASARRIKEATEKTAMKPPQPEAKAAEVERSASRKKTVAAKGRVSASAKKPAAKDQEAKPRKRRVVEGKESKSAGKGKK